jgi:hypothetical protein
MDYGEGRHLSVFQRQLHCIGIGTSLVAWERTRSEDDRYHRYHYFMLV